MRSRRPAMQQKVLEQKRETMQREIDELSALKLDDQDEMKRLVERLDELRRLEDEREIDLDSLARRSARSRERGTSRRRLLFRLAMATARSSRTTLRNLTRALMQKRPVPNHL